MHDMCTHKNLLDDIMYMLKQAIIFLQKISWWCNFFYKVENIYTFSPKHPFTSNSSIPFLAMYQYNNEMCSYNRIIMYTAQYVVLLCREVFFFLIQRLTLLLLSAATRLLLTLHYVLPFAFHPFEENDDDEDEKRENHERATTKLVQQIVTHKNGHKNVYYWARERKTLSRT